MKPALIIGSTCADIIINIDHLPKTEENIHPYSQSMSIGGCAYNVSHIFRLMHVPHTFITPVGGGIYGDFVAKQMDTLGIPTAIRVPDQENGCCYCLVEATGERTFLSLHGAEYTFRKSWMEPYPASDYGWVYVCGLEIEEATGTDLIEYLEEHRELSVCYAPGPRGVKIDPQKTSRMLALRPMLHINEQEAIALSGMPDYKSAAGKLQEITKNTVIVTLGARGAYYLEKGGASCLIPSVPVTKTADTIGAGDSHIGAVLACLTMDIPLHTAVSYANHVASAVVGIKGASLPPKLLPVFPSL